MAHKIIVKNEHFKNCESYSSNTHCPLALAIKEQLPELKNLWVGGTIVKLDEKQFSKNIIVTIHNTFCIFVFGLCVFV
jgi:hypothetical protein